MVQVETVFKINNKITKNIKGPLPNKCKSDYKYFGSGYSSGSSVQ